MKNSKEQKSKKIKTKKNKFYIFRNCPKCNKMTLKKINKTDYKCVLCEETLTIQNFKEYLKTHQIIGKIVGVRK